MLGNGLGQYAAACVAGVMTWEDGLRLVAERSRIMTAVPEEAALSAGGKKCQFDCIDRNGRIRAIR